MSVTLCALGHVIWAVSLVLTPKPHFKCRKETSPSELFKNTEMVQGGQCMFWSFKWTQKVPVLVFPGIPLWCGKKRQRFRDGATFLQYSLIQCWTCSPETTHRLQSSQKHTVFYPQVLENEIHCQHKNQRISHKSLCYWLLTKFSSENSGAVFPQGKNQLVWGGDLCLDGSHVLPLATAPTSCLTLADTWHLWPVRLSKGNGLCNLSAIPLPLWALLVRTHGQGRLGDT